MTKLAAHYRILELADRMRQGGLACPKCGCVSTGHQVIDTTDDPHLVCAGCGARFTADDLVTEPVFEMDGDLVVLYRPVGPKELAKIEASSWTRFPPRLAAQPIFYPVLNQRYAEYIAEKWNVPESRSGFVAKFRVPASMARKYPVQVVGAAWHQELWVPAEELEAFNHAIVGKIEVVKRYGVEAAR